MKPTYHPAIYKFSLLVVAWTLVLLIAGALVTSEDAALSVPDWPLSYGSLTPPMVGGIVFEHTHRIIATILGLLIVILAIAIWRKEERGWVRWLALAAVGGVIVQGILGGLTVLKLLHYWLPVLHACVAQIMFGLVVCISLVSSRWWLGDHEQLTDSGSPSIHALVALNAAAILVQIALGAAYRHKYYAVTPHVAWALVVFLIASWTAFNLKKRFHQSKELSLARAILHGIVGLQLILGIGALWTRITAVNDAQPMPLMVGATVIHTVVGAILFAVSIFVVLLCRRLVAGSRELASVPIQDRVPAQ
jgi:cytochrome c oxidase assembly protein subunit 15